MKNEKIFSSWNKIEASEEADKRMLGAILEHNSKNERSADMKNIKKIKVKRFVPALAAILAAFVLTVGVGAATGLIDSNFLQNLFGYNAPVLEEIKTEINYEVFFDPRYNDKPLEGFEFIVTGFHATDDAAMIIMDVISEEPIFTEEKMMDFAGSNPAGSYFTAFFALYDGITYTRTTDDIVITSSSAGRGKSFFVNENQITVVLYPFIINGGQTGGEYIFDIHENFNFTGFLTEEEYISGSWSSRKMSIRITIDEDDIAPTKTVNADVQLPSGSILNQVKISPFAIYFYYSGSQEFDEYTTYNWDDDENDDWDYSRIYWGREFAGQIILKDGTILGGGDSVHHVNISFRKADEGVLAFFLDYDKTIDINEVEAIIYRGVHIPIN